MTAAIAANLVVPLLCASAALGMLDHRVPPDPPGVRGIYLLGRRSRAGWGAQRWDAPRTRSAMLTSTAAKPTARARPTM